MKTESTVKRLCIKCTRLTSPDGFAYILRGYQCMCLGCDADETETHGPPTAGSDTQKRMNPNA